MKKQILALSCAFVSVFGYSQQVRNCGTMEHLEYQSAKDPSIIERMEAIETFTAQKLLSNRSSKVSGEIITLPVVVHVLYNTSAQNISEAQILSQIEVLNEDFRRTNSDADNTWSQAADTQIEFALATIDPNGNATSGITRTYSNVTAWEANDSMKSSSNGGVDPWNTSQYLNMWICPLESGLLGYAQFPGGDASTDGVVMAPQYFGSSDKGNGFYLSAPFDKGRTTTHEVGHFLNLRHIWGDGNCSLDDFVSDTPSSDAANYGCTESHTSCGSLDMVQNFMDYSDDSCMNLFTEGQKDRMRTVLEVGGARRSLALSDKFDGATTGDDSTDNDNDNGGGANLSYCSSAGGDSSYEWIDYVAFGGFANSTGDNGGYADFTNFTASVAPGSTNTLVISAGFAGTSYTEYWSIWIDYDQDGTFEDSEVIASGSSSSSDNLSVNVTIPTTASLGTTTMRVSMKYDAAQTACETFSYGEVEDYSVNISNSARTLRTTITDATALSNEESIQLLAYPNPTTKAFALKMGDKNATIENYRVINLSGQSVLQGGAINGTVDVSTLASGLYIVEIYNGQKKLTTNLVIQ